MLGNHLWSLAVAAVVSGVVAQPLFRAPVGTRDILPPESARRRRRLVRRVRRSGRADRLRLCWSRRCSRTSGCSSAWVISNGGRHQGDVRVLRQGRPAPSPGPPPRAHGKCVPGLCRVAADWCRGRSGTPAPSSATSAPRRAATGSSTRSGWRTLGTDDPHADVEVIGLGRALLRGTRYEAGTPADQQPWRRRPAGPPTTSRWLAYLQSPARAICPNSRNVTLERNPR